MPSSRKGQKENTEPEIAVKRRLSVSQDGTAKESKWDSLKGAVYDTFDIIGEVPSKVSLKPSNDDPSSDLGIRRAPLAYSNTVGKTTGPSPLLSNLIPEEPETPGEKLLKEYQSASNISGERKSSNNNININLDYNPAKEDDLYSSDSRKLFDSVKGGIYKSFDSTLRSVSNVGNQKKSPALLLSDSNRIRPMAKTSINKVKGRANEDISLSERKRQQREKKLKRKDNIEGTKETLYNVIDGIQTVGEAVVALPEKVGQTVEVTQDVLVGASVKVQDTIEGAQAFPGKVKNLVEDVRDSVEETKRITEEVSLDIKNIPKTIEGKISDTKDSIRETKEGVLNVVKRGEEAVYSAKVIAGLAKPKPKPPPPPKPKTASDIALQVTGSLVWFVAKGSTNIIVSGTKVAWSAFGPSSKKVAIAKQSNDNNEVINKAVQEVDILSKPNIPIDLIAEPVVSKPKKPIDLTVEPVVSKPNIPTDLTVEPVVSETTELVVSKPNIPIDLTAEPVVSRPKKPIDLPVEPVVLKTTEPVVSKPKKPIGLTAEPVVSKPNDPIDLTAEPVVSKPNDPINLTAEPAVSKPKKPIDLTTEPVISKPNEPINPTAEPVISKPNDPVNLTAKPEVSKPNNPINPAADTVVSQAATSSVDSEKPTLAQIDPSLEKQVNEALRLAEEALASFEKEGVTDGDIDAALQKAKLAALKATKDAQDLQDLIRKRSIR